MAEVDASQVCAANVVVDVNLAADADAALLVRAAKQLKAVTWTEDRPRIVHMAVQYVVTSLRPPRRTVMVMS
jgi:hypothetical protein